MMSLLAEVIEVYKRYNLKRQVYKVYKATQDIAKTAKICDIPQTEVERILKEREDKIKSGYSGRGRHF